MDLNYILSRHQLSLFAAEIANGPEARDAHLILAQGYAARIHRGEHNTCVTANSAPIA